MTCTDILKWTLHRNWDGIRCVLPGCNSCQRRTNKTHANPAICTIFWLICACVIFPFWSTWCITGSMWILKGQKRKHDFLLHTYWTQMCENMTSGKTKIWLSMKLVPFNIHQPYKKPRLPDLLPTWRLDLLRTNASWPVRGGWKGFTTCTEQSTATFGGFETFGTYWANFVSKIFRREHWKRLAGKVHIWRRCSRLWIWWLIRVLKLFRYKKTAKTLPTTWFPWYHSEKSCPLQRHENWKKSFLPRPPCLGEKLHWNVKLTLDMANWKRTDSWAGCIYPPGN